jgi:hypothetical protein
MMGGVSDRYWDGGRRRRSPAREPGRGRGATAFAWVEGLVVAAAVLVWLYGMWIVFTDDLQRGLAYAIPAALVLMVCAWRRGVFALPL